MPSQSSEPRVVLDPHSGYSSQRMIESVDVLYSISNAQLSDSEQVRCARQGMGFGRETYSIL